MEGTRGVETRVCLNFVALPVGGKASCVFRFSRAAHQQRNFRTARAAASVFLGGQGLRVQTATGAGTDFKQNAQKGRKH